MGIPDFRVFRDPYVSMEDDYRKAEVLMEHYDRSSFSQLLARYWELTPNVPRALVHTYIHNALTVQDRCSETWKMIESMESSIGRGRLLEIGCGTAGFLAAAGPAFHDALGMDIAFRWLIVAKKRLEERGIANATLICGCAEYLPFPDGVFDLVIAEDVLDHARDQEAFMREGARVLKRQGGVFYLSTPNRYSLAPDPHVWVWGVGFLPSRLRDRYVRWRKGIAYGPIRPVSYFRLRKLLQIAPLSQSRIMLPELFGVDAHRFSFWKRTGLHLYRQLRTIPVIRSLLRLVGPSFQVLCRTSGNAAKA